MSYFVTFGALRKSALNLFGQPCILLSELESNTSKLRVVEVWAFYGISSEGGTHSWARWLKTTALGSGFDIDFTDNHCFFRHVPIRDLEMNSDLYLEGSTFELTQDQFNTLSTRCTAIYEGQNKAILDAVNALNLIPKANKIKQYAFEDDSQRIFKYENELANKESRASRLLPFSVARALPGEHRNDSHDCTEHLIAVLATVLSPAQIELLHEEHNHPVWSRLRGASERLYLHGTGPLTQSPNNKNYYHRSLGHGSDAPVALYFTIPPQCLDGSREMKRLFEIKEVSCDQIKLVVGRLQRIWWVLLHAGLDEHESLVRRVRVAYVVFSNLRYKTGFKNNFDQSFFISAPSVSIHLRRAENLVKSIYEAIEAGGETGPFPNELAQDVSVVAFLSKQSQKELCTILGKEYPESVWDNADHEIATYIN